MIVIVVLGFLVGIASWPLALAIPALVLATAALCACLHGSTRRPARIRSAGPLINDLILDEPHAPVDVKHARLVCRRARTRISNAGCLSDPLPFDHGCRNHRTV
jgi:hypothetical protein